MMRLLWARVLYMWGSLHRNFGNRFGYEPEHRAAIRYFSRAYAIDPTLRDARLDRAIIHARELGEVEAALVDYDALLEEDPSFGRALINRSLLYQETGRFPEALADLEAFLALDDQDEEYVDTARRLAALIRDILTDDDAES